MTDKHQLMTAREVAEALRVSEAWVRSHATGRRKPLLPAIRLGERKRVLRFRRSDIDAFLDRYTNNDGASQEGP